MRGKVTLWLPGVDHAGIATQSVVEKMLKKVNIQLKEKHSLSFIYFIFKL